MSGVLTESFSSLKSLSFFERSGSEPFLHENRSTPSRKKEQDWFLTGQEKTFPRFRTRKMPTHFIRTHLIASSRLTFTLHLKSGYEVKKRFPMALVKVLVKMLVKVFTKAFLFLSLTGTLRPRARIGPMTPFVLDSHQRHGCSLEDTNDCIPMETSCFRESRTVRSLQGFFHLKCVDE